jgi:tRNA nucleotidyltransferase/poly(A) polymerase
MRRAARRIVEKLRLHGHEAFFAGGWVRDFLLRRKPKDIDIATSAEPDEVMRIFSKSRALGAQFGVIQVPMYGHVYEVATFRRDDAYFDGRHPSSVSFCGPEQDALRRDFTINGMFYDPIADRLIDYVRGRYDIQDRLIRTIGDPVARFTEDKLRMLRAVRLSCNIGFQIIPETWDAITKLAPDITQVSWERIRDELTRLFIGPAPDAGLDLLRASGLLGHILPEVAAMSGVPQPTELLPEADVFAHTKGSLALLRKPSPVLAFGVLLHDVGKPSVYSRDKNAGFGGHAQIGAMISKEICRRLRMSNGEIDQIVDLVHTHMEFEKIGTMRKSELIRLLRKPNISDHMELFRIDCLSGGKGLEAYSAFLEKLREFKSKPANLPLIRGEDLIALGYSPGPIFSEILRLVEDLQLEGILRTREETIKCITSTFPIAGKPQP